MDEPGTTPLHLDILMCASQGIFIESSLVPIMDRSKWVGSVMIVTHAISCSLGKIADEFTKDYHPYINILAVVFGRACGGAIKYTSIDFAAGRGVVEYRAVIGAFNHAAYGFFSKIKDEVSYSDITVPELLDNLDRILFGPRYNLKTHKEQGLEVNAARLGSSIALELIDAYLHHAVGIEARYSISIKSAVATTCLFTMYQSLTQDTDVLSGEQRYLSNVTQPEL